MDKYTVKLLPAALRELEGIYEYIAGTFLEPGTALEMLELLEREILSLEIFPYRNPLRKRGIYADKGYRQLFVKNYTVIYRVDEPSKTVYIVTIRYSGSEF